jgi:transketolase
VDTYIGYGAPHKQDSPQVHGEPLGEDEVRAAKRFYGWPEGAHFLVPDGVYEHFREGIGRRGGKLRAEWFALFEPYVRRMRT